MKIVLDLFYKYDADVFYYDSHKNNFGISWIPILHEIAKKQGFSVILADTYLKEGQFSSKDLIISEGITHNTNKLLFTSAKPFILFYCESPNIDWKFYTLLNKYSRSYKYALLFSGCESHINKSTFFKPLFWPNNTYSLPSYGPPYLMARRKKLVMIAANKKQNSVSGSSLIKFILKNVGMKFLTKTIPSVKLRDLYLYRMKALKFFSKKGYFSLYGRNWNNFSNLSQPEKEAVIKLSPKEVINKYEALGEHQFALCFENCIYPGYVTEKIFDCFIARCIPIYLGAPDIEEFVPKDLFIDMRSFRNFVEVDNFITNLSENEWLGYLSRMDDYLKSESFNKFTDTFFAQRLIEMASLESPTKTNKAIII